MVVLFGSLKIEITTEILCPWFDCFFQTIFTPCFWQCKHECKWVHLKLCDSWCSGDWCNSETPWNLVRRSFRNFEPNYHRETISIPMVCHAPKQSFPTIEAKERRNVLYDLYDVFFLAVQILHAIIVPNWHLLLRQWRREGSSPQHHLRHLQTWQIDTNWWENTNVFKMFRSLLDRFVLPHYIIDHVHNLDRKSFEHVLRIGGHWAQLLNHLKQVEARASKSTKSENLNCENQTTKYIIKYNRSILCYALEEFCVLLDRFHFTKTSQRKL